MKKQLIATAVGGIILFFCQFLSWALLNFHKNNQQYTPNQERILQNLTQNLSENGTYLIPQPVPGASSVEQEAFMNNNINKPWAIVSYHQSFHVNMGLNMSRGLAVDLLTAFLLCWLLLQFARLTFQTALLGALAVGAMAYFTIPYLDNIWFENKTGGYLIDWVLQWGLLGIWLGWYLPKK
ncbi:MAG: hypothetical protein KGS48_04950 [Bacteroidetes bacterium]|nr:hypothetical protein [Bacteroidota bacterium]